MRHRSPALTLVIVGLALTLLGCGGGDDGESASVADEPTTEAETPDDGEEEPTTETTAVDGGETTTTDAAVDPGEGDDGAATTEVGSGAADYCTAWEGFIDVATRFPSGLEETKAFLADQLARLADLAALAPPGLAADIATVTAAIEQAQADVEQVTADEDAVAAMNPALAGNPEYQSAAMRLRDHNVANCPE